MLYTSFWTPLAQAEFLAGRGRCGLKGYIQMLIQEVMMADDEAIIPGSFDSPAQVLHQMKMGTCNQYPDPYMSGVPTAFYVPALARFGVAKKQRYPHLYPRHQNLEKSGISHSPCQKWRKTKRGAN
ncbi:MAG: hypothetical protein HY306_13025 [Nitrosomonadales bacterium]|nr:hypothetical protein [Nitrosomonadales bacterium]